MIREEQQDKPKGKTYDRGKMNLLAIIIIVLAIAAAGAIIYAAWELSSDKPATRNRDSAAVEPDNGGKDRPPS
jgi:flagellar basal body-associated protein FliL